MLNRTRNRLDAILKETFDIEESMFEDYLGPHNARYQLECLKSGYLDAAMNQPRNLWAMHNVAIDLARQYDWSLENTEALVRKFQKTYQRGYNFYLARTNTAEFKPRFVKLSNS